MSEQLHEKIDEKSFVMRIVTHVNHLSSANRRKCERFQFLTMRKNMRRNGGKYDYD